MVMPRVIHRTFLILVASSLLTMAAPATVFAGIVTTSEIVNKQQIEQDRDRLQKLLDREDVRKALTLQGVDAAAAKSRVANMTDKEIQTLALQMDQLPAGGKLSNLEVVLIVLLIVILI